MKRAGAWFFLVLPLLISSAPPLPAQSPDHAGNTLTILEAHPAVAGCPVVIHAQHSSAGASTFLLAKGQKPEQAVQQPEIAQQLHLTFGNDGTATVTGVQITVHGTSAKSGMTRTQSEVFGANAMTKTLKLSLAITPNAEAALDLSLRAFTSVQQIDLDGIRYADGSGWQSPSAQACTFTPDGTMLIAGR